MNIIKTINLYFVVETRKGKIVKLKTWVCQKLWVELKKVWRGLKTL